MTTTSRAVTVLGEAVGPDLAEDRPVLLQPLGSCEQHGPHLPLDTDARIAEAIAHRVAKTTPGVIVGPVLAYGASGEHAGFPGTLSIGTAALTQVLVELVRDADRDFSGVLVLNAHGGNVDALHAADEQSTREGRRLCVWHATVPGGDAHAGRTETSLLLALAPHLVRPARDAGALDPLRTLLPALRSGGVRAVSGNGVLGDPRGASSAEGHLLLDQLVASAVRAAIAVRAPRMLRR